MTPWRGSCYRSLSTNETGKFSMGKEILYGVCVVFGGVVVSLIIAVAALAIAFNYF